MLFSQFCQADLVADTIRWVPETPAPLPPGMGLPEALSKATFAELVQKSAEETSKGARLSMPFHSVLARKKE